MTRLSILRPVWYNKEYIRWRSLLAFIFCLFKLTAIAEGGARRPIGTAVLTNHNHSARVSGPNAYTQPITRGIKQYAGMLGRPFINAIQHLGTDDVVVEPGAGLGALSMEIAKYTPARSIAINAQDFWASLRTTADSPLGYPEDRLTAIAEIIGGDWELKVKRDRSAVTRALKDLEETGRFSTLVGYVENILPTLKLKARLIPDVYSAYFYSPNRGLILQQYYNALKVEKGVGLVFVQPEPGWFDSLLGNATLYPVDHVHTKVGERMSLIEYLTKRYPKNFQLLKSNADPITFNWGSGLYGSHRAFDFAPTKLSAQVGGAVGDVLMITSTPDLPELKLPLEIDVDQRDWVTGDGGFEFSTDNQYYEVDDQ